MKKAFTLVELLISVTIVALTLGGGIIYFNNFNQRQKVERTERQIVTDLELVQSYARTRQVPMGFTGGDLAYVQVQINGDSLVAGANGVGVTFFSDKLPYAREIGVEMLPAVIYYWAGSGKVSDDAEGNFLGENEDVAIQIRRNDSQTGYKEIRINVLGQIRYLGYQEGVGSIPTTVISPTVFLSPTPTTIPCVNPGQSCSPISQCCSGSCYSGVCMDCRPDGIECRDDIDCCGGNCYGGFCASALPTPSGTACASPGETNPYYLESPPYSEICVAVYSCGHSDQFCQ